MISQKCKCQRCGHIWEYTGNKLIKKVSYSQFVQCSKCKTSVKLIVSDVIIKECRFKKTCEKKKCGYIINFTSCKLYKKYVNEISKKKISYLGVEK